MRPKNFDYSPISERTKNTLPDGARIAVWLVMNIENWYLESPARSILAVPARANVQIDVPNYAWHDYGMRVGFWRIKPLLLKYGIRPTIALNGSVCEDYPKVAEGCKENGWEIMGHGFTQRVLPKEKDEDSVISNTAKSIKSFFGRRPRGWLGPGLAETKRTLGLLAKNGFDYVCDWVCDDQPFVIKIGKSAKIFSVPYTLELNDIVLFANQHLPAEEFYSRVKMQFDTLYQEGEENPRVMAIAIHPYLSGVPHRIKMLEKILSFLSSQDKVWIATGSEILDNFVSNQKIS